MYTHKLVVQVLKDPGRSACRPARTMPDSAGRFRLWRAGQLGFAIRPKPSQTGPVGSGPWVGPLGWSHFMGTGPPGLSARPAPSRTGADWIMPWGVGPFCLSKQPGPSRTGPGAARAGQGRPGCVVLNETLMWMPSGTALINVMYMGGCWLEALGWLL